MVISCGQVQLELILPEISKEVIPRYAPTRFVKTPFSAHALFATFDWFKLGFLVLFQ